jgi:hypothetical protein
MTLEVFEYKDIVGKGSVTLLGSSVTDVHIRKEGGIFGVYVLAIKCKRPSEDIKEIKFYDECCAEALRDEIIKYANR